MASGIDVSSGLFEEKDGQLRLRLIDPALAGAIHCFLAQIVAAVQSESVPSDEVRAFIDERAPQMGEGQRRGFDELISAFLRNPSASVVTVYRGDAAFNSLPTTDSL